MMKLVSDNEEPVEPATVWKIVLETAKDTFIEITKQGYPSFSGPLFCIFPTEEEGFPPNFCVPYHRILYVDPVVTAGMSDSVN